MANAVLTPDIIAAESLMILENNCVFGNLVHRGYENDFSSVNGYKVGDTIRIAKPTDFIVRTGSTASIQDVTEGSINLTIDKMIGIDFQFTSTDLTTDIRDLSDRVLKPAMIQLANQIDRDVAGLAVDVWNWVGTPGLTVNAFSDFAKAPERLDLQAVPQDGRNAVLSPADQWGMLGSQTALYMQDVAKGAYRQGKLGMIANVDTYSSQNVKGFTTGTLRTLTTPLFNAALATSTTYAATKTTGTMNVSVDGWVGTSTFTAGEVFTIAGVYAVNAVTKVTLDYLQPFVIKTAATASGAGTATLTISPPIITSGAFQTVSAAPADNATVTILGTASTTYPSNLVFNKNAFALVVAPLIKQPGAVDVSRKSYKGYSARLTPYYSGSNDISSWRFDILYGVKTLDARQAVRLSGT
jgi:hypothetical protein